MVTSALQNKNNLDKVKDHFDSMSKDRDRWIRKGRYFHSEDLRVITEIIPSDSSVLEIGCGNGNLIGNLNVKKGVGVDLSDKLINLAKKKFQYAFIVMISFLIIRNYHQKVNLTLY